MQRTEYASYLNVALDTVSAIDWVEKCQKYAILLLEGFTREYWSEAVQK